MGYRREWAKGCCAVLSGNTSTRTMQKCAVARARTRARTHKPAHLALREVPAAADDKHVAVEHAGGVFAAALTSPSISASPTTNTWPLSTPAARPKRSASIGATARQWSCVHRHVYRRAHRHRRRRAPTVLPWRPSQSPGPSWVCGHVQRRGGCIGRGATVAVGKALVSRGCGLTMLATVHSIIVD